MIGAATATRQCRRRREGDFLLVGASVHGYFHGMFIARISSMLLALAVFCHAERVKFSEGAYSLEFPDGWKKVEGDAKPAPLVLMQNPDGTALFVVNQLAVPEGAQVDLDDTAKAIAAGHMKDLKLEKAPEPGEGEIDGLPARFLRIVPPKAAAPDAEPAEDEIPLAYLIVLIDTGKGVLILQATLAMPVAKATQEEALGVIQSFKREG